MKKTFEVGKWYSCSDTSFSPILIKRRTEKTVWVENDGGSAWMMRIKHDEKGNEFVTDSSSPVRWHDVFTYCADREEESYNKPLIQN